MTDGAAAALPRGRHHLSREEVRRAQRARMLLAMADALAEKGYAATSVADVVKRAGVSRETFYQQFSSKLDCFMHAFDLAGKVLLTRMRDDAPPPAAGATPVELFDRSFGLYLETLATNLSLARIFLVEVYAAGPEAMGRRAALQGRIIDGMVALLGLRGRGPQARFACEVLVAGIGAMVTGPLVAHDTQALRALREPVVDLVRRALAAIETADAR